MGPFPSSRGNKYVLFTMDYISKCVEAMASPTNESRVVLNYSRGSSFLVLESHECYTATEEIWSAPQIMPWLLFLNKRASRDLQSGYPLNIREDGYKITQRVGG